MQSGHLVPINQYKYAALQVPTMMATVPAVAAASASAAQTADAAPAAAAEHKEGTSDRPQKALTAAVSDTPAALLTDVEQDTSLLPPPAAAASKQHQSANPEAEAGRTVKDAQAELPISLKGASVVMTDHGDVSLRPSGESLPVKGAASPQATLDKPSAVRPAYNRHEETQANQSRRPSADSDALLAEVLADVSASAMVTASVQPAPKSPPATGVARKQSEHLSLPPAPAPPPATAVANKELEQPSLQVSSFHEVAALEAEHLSSGSKPVSRGRPDLDAETAGVAQFEDAVPAEHAAQHMLSLDEEVSGLLSSAGIPAETSSHSIGPDFRPGSQKSAEQTMDVDIHAVLEGLAAAAEADQQLVSHMGADKDHGQHSVPSIAVDVQSEQHSMPSVAAGVDSEQHSMPSMAANPLPSQGYSSVELLHESAKTESVEHVLLNLDDEMAGLAPPEHAAHAEPAEPAVLDLHEDMTGLGAASDTLEAAGISKMIQEDSINADVEEAIAHVTHAAIDTENTAGAERNAGMVVL